MPQPRSLALLAASALIVVATALAASASPAPAAPDRPGAKPRMCDGKVATIVGTAGKDTITGTAGNDVIVGLAGRDRIDGRGGNDRICGGEGADHLIGGPGDDRVFGQGDGCYHDEGCFPVGNTMVGGPGDDLLSGTDPGDPDTVLFTHAVRGLTVDLEAGTAQGQGHDRLIGVGSLTTTPFDDEVRGLEEFGNLDTLEGDDLVTDIAKGWYGYADTGPGDDVVVKDRKGNGDVALGEGDDTVTALGGTVFDGSGDDTVTATGTLPRYEGLSVYLAEGDDSVQGSEGSEEIWIDERSGAGADAGSVDVLTLRGGDDAVYAGDGQGRVVLDAGAGDDTVSGGVGDDDLDGGDGTDSITYGALYGAGSGAEIDLAAGTASGASGDDALAGFENAGGTPQDDEIWGDAGPNELNGDGSDGTDVLHGRAGADRLVIQFGAAELHGDGGDDVLQLDASSGDVDGLLFDGGADHDLFLFTDYLGFRDAMTIDLSLGTITGNGTAPITGIEDVTDNGGPHTLIGDDGPNVLTGSGGADDLRGLGGDDTLVGGAGQDSADGGADTDACEAETVTACEG